MLFVQCAMCRLRLIQNFPSTIQMTLTSDHDFWARIRQFHSEFFFKKFSCGLAPWLRILHYKCPRSQSVIGRVSRCLQCSRHRLKCMSSGCHL